MKYKTHLWYGDCHVAPGQDLSRFEHLACWIIHNKPDVIGNIGDHNTFDSCSFFDVPRLEKTTIKEDVEAGNEALDIIDSAIEEYNDKQRANHKSRYKPFKVFTIGNHEYRLNRRLQQDEDVLGSLVSIDSLMDLENRFDKTCGYREYLEIDGVLFTHAVPNSRGTPISGVTRGRSITMQSSKPIMYGHTHKFDYTSVPLIGNDNHTRWSLNMPCFMDQNHVENYAKESTTGWCYGLVELRIYEDGNVSYRWISMQELKDFYKENK